MVIAGNKKAVVPAGKRGKRWCLLKKEKMDDDRWKKLGKIEKG